MSTNPFKYGPIALDESFTDRESEVAEVIADALNGQDVVIFARRRFGKTSLVHRAEQRLATRKALVASGKQYCPPKAACGPSASGTWDGVRGVCVGGHCAMPK